MSPYRTSGPVDTVDDRTLRDVLQETVSFLERVGETGWASEIRKELQREGAIPPNVVLSWFGSMGSLNDLTIMAANGHKVRVEDERVANAQLNTLIGKIYELAQAEWREERDRPRE
jgi:hypothetical protein